MSATERVVGTAGGDHHMVDRTRQALEELRELVGVRGVECRSLQRANLECGLLQMLGIATGEDDLGPLRVCSAAGFGSMPELPPMTTTLCPVSSGWRVASTTLHLLVIAPSTLARSPGQRGDTLAPSLTRREVRPRQPALDWSDTLDEIDVVNSQRKTSVNGTCSPTSGGASGRTHAARSSG